MAASGRRLGSGVLVVLVMSGLAGAVVRERTRTCRTRGGEPYRLHLSCSEPRYGEAWAEMPGRDRLAFDPPAPRPGDVVSVTYRPDGRFGGHSRLSVRRGSASVAEYAWRRLSSGTATTLDRTGDVYLGTFRLPADALHTQFVVESEDGSEIDSNGGLMWEITAHGPDGGLLYDGLIARARANWEVDARRLHETGRLLQSLAPRRPWGRFARVAAEEKLAGTWGQRVTRGATARAYRAVYADLRERPGLDAQDLVALEEWASRILHPSRTEWRDRLLSEFPASQAARSRRDLTAQAATSGNARARLDSLHSIWGDANLPEWDFARRAVTAAESSPELMLEIIDRHPGLPATVVATAAGFLPDSPAYRDVRRRLQQDAAARAYELLDREDHRAITQTTAEHAEARRARECANGSYVAQRLVHQGAVFEALRVLDAAPAGAAEFDCDDILRMRAGTRLLAGDSAGSLADWTDYAARSPERRSAHADSARRASRTFDVAQWTEMVRAREQDVWRRVLASNSSRTVPEFSVSSVTGESVTADQWRGTPLVLMLTTLEAIRGKGFGTVQAMAEGVAPLNVRWIVVVKGAPPTDGDAFVEPTTVPIYFDPRGEAGARLGQRRLHEFVVIDARGRIRFRTEYDYIARRRAVMLSAEPELNATRGTSIAAHGSTAR